MQLSEDHTVLARLRAAGVGAGEEDDLDADGPSHWRGVLTNALGMGDATRVATFVVPLYSGDRFLLCSDGVYEYFDEAEIAELLSNSVSPARAANRLIELAVDRGGHDNATAVVVKVVEAGETKVPPEQRDRDQDALTRCALFGPLSPQERLRALRITTYREFKPEKQLPGIAMSSRLSYIVLEGDVIGPRGQRCGPGDIIYPEALIEGTVFGEDDFFQAEGSVRALVVRRDDFLELTEEESDLGVKLYAVLAKLMAR
jgi:hypothetical protein